MDNHVIAANGEPESEWEYEYDANETEDCYFTLDLTTHVPGAVEEKQYAKNGKRVPSKSKSNSKDAETQEQQQPDDEPQATNENATGDQDSPAKPENTFQLVGLHTRTPYIKFNADFYACHWHTDLGTQLYLSKPGVIDSPRHAGHILDVVATSQTRLVAIPANLKRKRDSHESSDREIRPAEPQGVDASTATNLKDGPAEDVDLGIHTGPAPKTPLKILDKPDDPHLRGQASFMERLSALKLRRGEPDALKVPLAMPKYYHGASNPLELREVARTKDRAAGPVPEIVTAPRGAAGSRRIEEAGWARKSKRNPHDLIISGDDDDDANDTQPGAEAQDGEGDAVPPRELTELEAAMVKAREMQQGRKKLSRGFKGGAPTKASLRAGLGLGTSGLPRRRGRPTNAERARRAAEEEAVRRGREGGTGGVGGDEGAGGGGVRGASEGEVDGMADQGGDVGMGEDGVGEVGPDRYVRMGEAGEQDAVVAQAYPVLAQAGRTSTTPNLVPPASIQSQETRGSPSDAPPPRKSRKVSFAPMPASPDQADIEAYPDDYNDDMDVDLDAAEQPDDDEDDYTSASDNQDPPSPDIHPSTTRRLSTTPATKKSYTPDLTSHPSNRATNRRRATAADATGAAAPHPSTPASAPDIDPTTGRPIWRRRNKTQMAEYRASELELKGLFEAAAEVRRKEVERQEGLKVNVQKKERERSERRLQERWEARVSGEGEEECGVGGELGGEGRKRLRGWWGKRAKERQAEEEERMREAVRERVMVPGQVGTEIRWRLERGGAAEAEGDEGVGESSADAEPPEQQAEDGRGDEAITQPQPPFPGVEGGQA